MGAADASGLVVSYIQSLYWEFGSGCVLPRTGVLMQNRGASFSLDPKRAQPRWRPAGCRSTRSTRRWPCCDDGRDHGLRHHGRRRPAADAGGVLHAPRAALASRSTEAIDAPRWLLGRTWGSTHHQPADGSRFDGNLIDRLMSAGHDVEVLPDAYSDTMGHAGAVVLHPNGTLEGAHDPRADGGAAGV